MAIFIALIFQVLFVFFAMIVNIGLIVHDKINLQNSVDIAAYYGAQRQAEMLNAIAHQNYEVRQAWKLLAWRVRVLGDMGNRNHPLQKRNMGKIFKEASAYGNAQVQSLRVPTVCINNELWGIKQNLCSDEKIHIPELPDFKIINPFFPLNFVAKITTGILKKAANQDGSKTGPMNFNIALRWARAYRVQIAKSKETMRAYADLLSKEPTDFTDIYGGSASLGALKTLKNNLTRANAKALADGGEQSFRFFNSLGSGDRKKWLNEVPIYPAIYYTDLYQEKGWKAVIKQINGKGSENRPVKDLKPNDEEDIFRNEPQNVNDLYHSIYGAEKNPWMMAYVGVYAETKPRKPYLPFGEPITLKAKAFAKPFGGRIGPWYYARWPETSPRSVGNDDQRIDILAPLPLDEKGALTASASMKDLGVPNYSRFPGDRLGLNSLAALALFKDEITKAGRSIDPGSYSGTPTGGDGLAMATAGVFDGINNVLPMLRYQGPWIRELEVAAIAPDLFDATYYSVERDSYHNYSKPSVGGKILKEIPYDIGSIQIGEVGVKNIADQISIATKYESPLMNFWMIKNPNHLLTGWAPSGAFQYNFPKEVFGECISESTDNTPVPGKCARGGRVGYSVKIISEDYLNSSELPLGGEGLKGRIKNPPPADF